jgi:flagellar basal body P-ring formation protein FlgA
VTERRTISVTPNVRVMTLVLLRDIERGGVVGEADVESAMQWLTPAQQALVADPASIAGRQAATRLRVGEMLRDQHLRRETVIRRGEQVIVRCLVGGAVIALQAEARSDAAIGETTDFRKLGERDTFLAVVTGRGEAIVDLSR